MAEDDNKIFYVLDIWSTKSEFIVLVLSIGEGLPLKADRMREFYITALHIHTSTNVSSIGGMHAKAERMISQRYCRMQNRPVRLEHELNFAIVPAKTKMGSVCLASRPSFMDDVACAALCGDTASVIRSNISSAASTPKLVVPLPHTRLYYEYPMSERKRLDRRYIYIYIIYVCVCVNTRGITGCGCDWPRLAVWRCDCRSARPSKPAYPVAFGTLNNNEFISCSTNGEHNRSNEKDTERARAKHRPTNIRDKYRNQKQIRCHHLTKWKKLLIFEFLKIWISHFTVWFLCACISCEQVARTRINAVVAIVSCW